MAKIDLDALRNRVAQLQTFSVQFFGKSVHQRSGLLP